MRNGSIWWIRCCYGSERLWFRRSFSDLNIQNFSLKFSDPGRILVQIPQDSDQIGSGRVGSDRIGSDPPPHQCRPRARPHSGQEPKRNRRKSSAHGRKRPLQAVRSPASAPAAKVDHASAVEGLGSSRQRHHALHVREGALGIAQSSGHAERPHHRKETQ